MNYFSIRKATFAERLDYGVSEEDWHTHDHVVVTLKGRIVLDPQPKQIALQECEAMNEEDAWENLLVQGVDHVRT